MSRDIPHITTVLGDIPAAELGACLFHEHLLVDLAPFRGGDDDVTLEDVQTLGQELDLLRQADIESVVDATTPDIGRDVIGLRQASAAAGIHVVAGTGFHHSATYPDDLRGQDAHEIADRFIREADVGVDDTGIRVGVIGEVGTRGTEFTPLERVVFRAAAMAQRQTGLGIITHTAEGALALEQIRVLIDHGADPARMAIGHLDCADDTDIAMSVAREGCFVGIDRCGIEWLKPDEFRIRLVLELCEAGLDGQILLSSDVGRRSRLHSFDGPGYTTVPRHIVPALLEAGVPPATVTSILTDNPRRLLSRPPTAS